MCPPFLKNEVRVRVDPCLRRTQHRDHPPSFNDGFCHSTRLVCFVNLRARVRGPVSSAVATLKRCHAPIFWKSKNFAAAKIPRRPRTQGFIQSASTVPDPFADAANKPPCPRSASAFSHPAPACAMKALDTTQMTRSSQSILNRWNGACSSRFYVRRARSCLGRSSSFPIEELKAELTRGNKTGFLEQNSGSRACSMRITSGLTAKMEPGPSRNIIGDKTALLQVPDRQARP